MQKPHFGRTSLLSFSVVSLRPSVLDTLSTGDRLQCVVVMDNYEMKPMASASVQEKDYGGGAAARGTARSQTTRVRVCYCFDVQGFVRRLLTANTATVQLHTDVLLRAQLHAVLGSHGNVRFKCRSNLSLCSHQLTIMQEHWPGILEWRSSIHGLGILHCDSRSPVSGRVDR